MLKDPDNEKGKGQEGRGCLEQLGLTENGGEEHELTVDPTTMTFS